MTDVKPCPFCGHQPDINDPDFCYPLNREKNIWQAGCTNNNCGAVVLGETKEDSIQGWDRRVETK